MVKIVKLLLCMSLFLPSINSQSTDSVYSLPSVSIQSNRIQENYLNSAKSVVFISQKDLEDLPVQTVQEALQYLAGVRIESRGFPHVQSDISIRGGSFDQALILIDGVKLNDAQTGHHLMNIPVPLDQIQRIEVIKGPSARIYGPNAFSGVINIITKDFENTQLNLRAYGGNLSAGGGGLNFQFKGKAMRHMISVSKDFSDGYRYNTAYDLSQYFYKTSMKFDQHELTFTSGFTSREFGANGFYADTSFREQEEAIQTSLTALQHMYRGSDYTLRTNAYWRRNQDEYVFNRKNPDLYRNFHLGNNIGIESHLNWINGLGVLGIGIDLRREMLRSSNLGDRNRNTFALALEQRFEFLDNRLSVTPGAFLNYYSDHGWNLLPGLDANYLISENWSISAAIGRTFRVPTYTDLYYIDPVNIGNPELEAERAFSQELSLKYARSTTLLQISAFRRNNESLIDWRKEGNTWMATNIDSVIFQGVEAQWEWRKILESQSFEITKIGLQYAYLYGAYLENENIQSRYTFDHQQQRMIASIGFRFFKSLTLHSAMRFAVPFEELLQPYSLWDLTLSFQWNNFKIFAEGINLTNTSYFGANGVPMPGRWIRMGCHLNFLSEREK